MSEDDLPEGAERVECDECPGGYTDVFPDGTIVQVHRSDCSSALCECGEDDCSECSECADEHFYDPSLVAVGLRLLIAAIDDDVDAVCMALGDIPGCLDCERSVWLSLLRTAGFYGTEAFADVLRKELLTTLDEAAARRLDEG